MRQTLLHYPNLFARQRLLWALLVALLTALLVLATLASPVHAQTIPLDQVRWYTVDDQGELTVNLFFFWSKTCPHCREAYPFVTDLPNQYPWLKLHALELTENQANSQLYTMMAEALGQQAMYVPAFFYCGTMTTGYDKADTSGEALVKNLRICRDSLTERIAAEKTVSAASGATAGESPAAAAPAEVTLPEETAAATTVPLPFIGTMDLSHQSLVVSTALLAFVDGVNPCSLWVLSVLLALSLHTGSRRKVLLIGLVFLTVTSLIYMLFISSLFTILSVVSFVGWIQIVVALVALFFAVVNIKDYFWYKKGISLTIADDKKPGLYRRMRAVLDAGNSTWGILGATVVLSAGVSLVEFSCTAGFPVLWTNLLTAQQATAATFGLLLLLYMLIYQIDELVIFLAAVFTLKAGRLEEKQGRILKLVGGMLMLTLAAVMLVNPEWMDTPSTALWVFAAAFGLTGAVLLAHRMLLPRLGVYVGTELRPPHRRQS
jgi:hypothetical protein